MSKLIDIARKLKGSQCKKLVKQTGNEVIISGLTFGDGSFKIDVGSFSNKIKEFYQVPQIMVALDISQYLLCGAIMQMKENETLKVDCIRIRLQLILAFNHLQALLSIPSPTEELCKEIVKWVKYMRQLNAHSIELLKPETRMISKGGKSKLMQISKYQGVNEEQMQEALQILK